MFKPHGIIPPIITPFKENGEVNYGVLRQMVDFLIDGGIHGLFPLGTTGEFYAFGPDTACEIIECVKEQAAGRVDIYAGANHITTRGVIELLHLFSPQKKPDRIQAERPAVCSGGPSP